MDLGGLEYEMRGLFVVVVIAIPRLERARGLHDLHLRCRYDGPHGEAHHRGVLPLPLFLIRWRRRSRRGSGVVGVKVRLLLVMYGKQRLCVVHLVRPARLAGYAERLPQCAGTCTSRIERRPAGAAPLLRGVLHRLAERRVYLAVELLLPLPLLAPVAASDKTGDEECEQEEEDRSTGEYADDDTFVSEESTHIHCLVSIVAQVKTREATHDMPEVTASTLGLALGLDVLDALVNWVLGGVWDSPLQPVGVMDAAVDEDDAGLDAEVTPKRSETVVGL